VPPDAADPIAALIENVEDSDAPTGSIAPPPPTGAAPSAAVPQGGN
jgi:hypothetical protein